MWLFVPLFTTAWLAGICIAAAAPEVHPSLPWLWAWVAPAACAIGWRGGAPGAALLSGAAGLLAGMAAGSVAMQCDAWEDERGVPALRALEDREAHVVGEVTWGARAAVEEYSMELRVEAISPDGVRWRRVDAIVRVAGATSPWFPVRGDRVHLRGVFRSPGRPLHPFAFDARVWARAEGFAGTFRPVAGPILLGSSGGAGRWLDRFRVRVERSLLTRIPGRAGPVVTGMVTGSRQEIDPDVVRTFTASGVSHVLAVSGSHLAILCMAFFQILERLLRRVDRIAGRFGAKRAAAAAALPFVAAYVVFTGATAAAVRAGVMAVAMLAAVVAERRTAGMHALWLAVLAMTLADPRVLFDLGFGLSVAATWGLIASARVRATRPRADSGDAAPGLVARGFGAVRESLVLSTVATLVTAPFLLWRFGAIPLLSPIANLLVVPPLGAVALPAGFFGGVADAAGIPGAVCLIRVAEWSTRLSLWVNDAGSDWFGWPLVWGRPGAIGMLGWIALALWAPRLNHLRWPRDLLVPFSFFVCACISPPPWLRPPGTLRIHAIPVGQGDCTFMELPDGTTLLVDAGGSSSPEAQVGRRAVLPYLRAIGYRRVDVFIATHPDLDHIGGLIELAPELRPSELWTGPFDRRGTAGDALLQAVSEAGGRWTALSRRARTVRIGDVRVDVAPDSLNPEIRDSDNDAGLVMRVCLHAACALLGGDVGIAREADLRDSGFELDSIYLKLSHHGSATSTDEAFLRAVRPRVAVVHVGERNRFGHPAPVVLDRVRGLGVWLRRTDRGQVPIFVIDGEAGWWEETPSWRW